MSAIKIKQINLNDVARKVSRAEGLKDQVNIAQIKEVMRCTLDVLVKDYSLIQFLLLIKRLRK